MTEDEEIIELFFARSERAIGALDDKYGRLCRKLSYNIVGDERDGNYTVALEEIEGCVTGGDSPEDELEAKELAVSDDFRQAVVSFLFPAYTDDRLHEIDEGHRTGSFSMEDTLFTFLERFNGEGMADVEAVKNDDGFEYVVLDGGDGAVNAVVDCTEPDYKLLVVMERVEYKDTTGLWQVTGYQIIDAEEADEMLGRY